MFGWQVIPRIGFGDFGISPHGIGIAIGYFVGALVMARQARKIGYDEDHVWNGAAIGVLGAMLGARVAYVVGHIEDYPDPLEWLRLWEGGLSLVGGLIGAFIAVSIYCLVKKISFFQLVDLGAPGLGIGIALGRSGDMAIGDHLGRATNGWWGWQYQGGELISPPPCTTPTGAPVYPSADGCLEPGMVVHQTAIYDSIWSFVIFGILLLLARKPRRRGFMFLSWASLYAIGRIATDFARVDKHWFGLGLTGSQLTSIAVLTLCGLLLIFFKGIPGGQMPPATVMDGAVVTPEDVPQAAPKPDQKPEESSDETQPL